MNYPNPQKYSSTMGSLKLLNRYGVAKHPYPNCVRKCSALLSLSEFEEKLWKDLVSCFEVLTQTWEIVRITPVADGKTRNAKCFFYLSSHWLSDKISLAYFFILPLLLHFPHHHHCSWISVLPRLFETCSTLFWEIQRTKWIVY